jgi:uncharacterized membrane protein
MTVSAAAVLAVIASTSLTVGLYFMKRAADRLPSLAGWQPAAWWAWVRDPWWLLGVGLQIAGFGLYVLALRWAPLSIVHTALNAGIALFVILAVLGLGERPSAREWVGVAAVTVALILLSVSLSSAPASSGTVHAMLPFSLALLALCGLGLLIDPTPRRPIGLSVATGILLGLGSVFTKTLANAPSLEAAVRNVYFPLAFAANLAGFLLMQAALQSGRGVIVMPIFSSLSNLVPIIGGIVVFSEALPEQGAAAVLRPLAFVLAIAGAGLLAVFGERQGGSAPGARGPGWRQ